MRWRDSESESRASRENATEELGIQSGQQKRGRYTDVSATQEAWRQQESLADETERQFVGRSTFRDGEWDREEAIEFGKIQIQFMSHMYSHFLRNLNLLGFPFFISNFWNNVLFKVLHYIILFFFKVSYVNGNVVRRHVAGNTYMTTFASEIALIEADKEADRKYRELILEAENILVSMQKHQNPSLCIPSPSRKLHNGLANKRVELIKNTELNIELALSKSRNSQPELQSGSIRDLEHTSPKRQFTQPCSPIHRFMERNSPAGTFIPKEPSSPVFRQHELSKCPDSPVMLRRTTPQSSPSRSLMHHQIHRARNGSDSEPRECNRSPRIALKCNGGPRLEAMDTNFHGDKTHANSMSSSLVGDRKEFCAARESTKEEGVTSSSSDSEEKCDVRRRAPLMTFRSLVTIL